ncbi:MAG: tyrosine-protein phosphatase [Hyphomonadaceae bacterium]|nr:tyrosine-protein phosphatase [Hyphomonadaceae bacterium]
MDRLIALQGVRNLRDFGGYETRWGGRVVTRTLFRSAHFFEASESDIAALNGLGIRLVCDLRRPEERTQYPSRWLCDPGRTILSDDGAKAEPPHLAFLRTGNLAPAAVSGYMRGMYREIPYDQRYVTMFADFIRALSEGETPALVHCAAGKDRTGIVCAMVLLALEVPKETVVEDYILTNEAVDLEGRLPKVLERFSQQVGTQLKRESVLPLLGVEESYLAAAMDSIEQKSGDVKTYLRDVLELDWTTLDRLRARLVK